MIDSCLKCKLEAGTDAYWKLNEARTEREGDAPGRAIS